MTNEGWPVWFRYDFTPDDFLVWYVFRAQTDAGFPISCQARIPPLSSNFAAFVAVLVEEGQARWQSDLLALEERLDCFMQIATFGVCLFEQVGCQPMTLTQVRADNLNMLRAPASMDDPELGLFYPKREVLHPFYPGAMLFRVFDNI